MDGPLLNARLKQSKKMQFSNDAYSHKKLKNKKTENNVSYLTELQILSQNSFSFCRLQIKLLDTNQGTVLFPSNSEHFFPQM